MEIKTNEATRRRRKKRQQQQQHHAESAKEAHNKRQFKIVIKVCLVNKTTNIAHCSHDPQHIQTHVVE